MSAPTNTAVTKPKLTTSAMIASIAAEGQRVRAAPFGKALVELAESRPEIVGLTADLAKYTDLHIFAQAYPERFFQMGMAEQLLMGAAGGMAKEGLITRQFMLGVVQTADGLPIYHEVFDGNQAEAPTLIATVQKVLARYAHIKRLIMVAAPVGT